MICFIPKITTGQEEVTQQTADGQREVITFSVNQSNFVNSQQSSAIEREIVGNSLNNTIEVQGRQNTIFGNEGSDRFILLGGDNLIDGGQGIDTAVINATQAEVGGITKNGDIVNIGSNNTLLNVEFVEFSDVRLALDDLSITPTLSLTNQNVDVREEDTGAISAVFTIDLSTPTTNDVVINYASRSNEATSGVDFVETTGQLTIAAGASSAEITLEILGDSDVEGDETVLMDFEIVSGATFVDGATTTTESVEILDNDSSVVVSTIGGNSTVIEGNSDTASTLNLNLSRYGSLVDSDTVQIELIPTGDNPAEASDFVNGLTPIEVTFAPDEDNKLVELAIATDSQIEADETFGVRITNVTGSALVPDEDLVFTILNDDFGNSIVGTSKKDVLFGTQDVDIIEGLEGKDFIFGLNGNDSIYGDSGKDKLFGGKGNDLIEGGTDKDVLFGGKGNDLIEGGADKDVLFGGSGRDTLNGGDDKDYLYGNEGDDILIGATIGDNQPGWSEKDVLRGGSGADLFVLGDRNGSFYVGKNKHDYAEIKDWSSVEGDMIQLSSQGNYSLGSSDSKHCWHKKISIFDDEDLIAVVKTKGGEHLDLYNSDQFSFV